MSYADGKYGVIERKWFGLTKKFGGDCADGYTFGTTDATTIDHLSRWYPKGPIRLLKAGHIVLATIAVGATAGDDIPARLRVNGANESGDWDIDDGAAPYAIASTVTFTNPIIDAGSYIGIRTGTAVSGDGTESNTATSTGTVAFFIDYVREYHQTKWDRS
jgi:hypothetical protein